MEKLTVVFINLAAGAFSLYVAVSINNLMSPLLVVLSLLNFGIACKILWEILTED